MTYGCRTSETFCSVHLTRPAFVSLLALTLLGALCVGERRLPDVVGQAGGPRVVVGAEPLIAYVHLRQPAMDLVGALVEPAAYVLAVRLHSIHRLLAVGCQAGLEGRGQAGAYPFFLGLQPLPVFLLVLGDPPPGLLVGLGLSPALLGLLGVILGSKLPEDLEPLLWCKPYVH